MLENKFGFPISAYLSFFCYLPSNFVALAKLFLDEHPLTNRTRYSARLSCEGVWPN